MPDFERVFRDLELQTTKNLEFTKGKFYGLDQARKEIAWLFGIVIVIGVFLYFII